MKSNTTQQSKPRFKPVKFPVSTPIVVSQPAEHQPTRDRPAKIETVQPRSGQPVAYVRHDAVSHPTPKLAPEKRLEKYVQSDRATLGKAVQNANQAAAATQQPQRPSNDDGLSQRLPRVMIRPEDHFVARSDFSNQYVDHPWGTPVALQSISIAQSPLLSPQPVHRVDQAHRSAEDAYLTYPVESPADVTDDNRQASGAAEPAPHRVDKILSDPQTAELVTAISTAIASVLKNQPEEAIAPAAQSLFEQNLKQHALVLDTPAEESDAEAASHAMLKSIAEQRQRNTGAPIDATHPSITERSVLIDQLKHQIASYQQACFAADESESQPLTAPVTPTATPIPAAATEIAASAGVQPMAAVVGTAVSAEQPASVDPSPVTGSEVQSDQKPMVQFTAPDQVTLPIEAAAWDVEAFRWPRVCNQMVVVGSGAIGQLLSLSSGQTEVRHKRIVIAGAGRSQGASTIAMTMARVAVAAGRKTLLIDADIASPSLSQRIGLAANMSWLNGIDKQLPPAELIVRSQASNLCIMPLSSTVTRVTWPRFILDNLGEIIASAKHHFDLVLVDAGPASQLLDELSHPENLLDGLVLVNATAKTKEIKTYQSRLQTFGIDKMIVAENQISTAAASVA